MKKIIFLSLFFLFFTAKNAFAVTLSVEAPQDVLTQGQTFDFKVNIDTKGTSISKENILFTYDKQYVQFDGVVEAGDFFDNVAFAKKTEGEVIIVADSQAAKSGSGLVAVVKLKIIATAPGSAQLCAATTMSITPTKSLPTPTNYKSPTSIPVKKPPVTGSFENSLFTGAAGMVIISLAMLFWFLT